MIRALLFDIGGTLVGDPRKAAWSELRLGGLGGRLDGLASRGLIDALERADAELDSPEYSHFLGEPAVVKRALESIAVEGEPALVEELVVAYRRAAVRVLAEHEELRPLHSTELAATLSDLRVSGATKLGIISNERRWAPQIYLAQVLGIDPSAFDAILTSDECGFGKPDPRIFQLGAARLGVALSEAAYVGDSIERDVIPALALGMTAIWFTGLVGDAFPNQPAGSRSIGDIRDLPAIVREANATSQPPP